MAETLCFYIDDSGPRDPDRKFDGRAGHPDWFALGGLIIRESHIASANEAIKAFRQAWPEIAGNPLRSYEIRNKTKRYGWLADASAARKERFMAELSTLIASLPIFAIACVIDRPGYNHRYREKYGLRRWLLCRTAFNIAVERAAKYALHHGARLRVFAERTDKATEGHLKGYFEQLRSEGAPFDKDNSKKYAPVAAEDLKKTLLEFRTKTKESDLMQIADLVLWPVCKGGYEPTHRTYVMLKQDGKLLEAECNAENGLLGTKYSCFDRVQQP